MKGTITTKWLFIVLALAFVLVACERPLQQPQPEVTVESPDLDNPDSVPLVPAATAPAGTEDPAQPENLGDPAAYPAPEDGGDPADTPTDETGTETDTTGENTDTTDETAGDPAPPAGSQSYTVQSGDTLGAIAEQFGVTWNELAAANGITNPDTLAVGDVLVIPEPGTVDVPTDDGTGDDPVTDEQTYTVQFGDSLYGIGLSFGFTIDELVAYNNLESPDTLAVGDVILIPPSDYELPSE